MTTALQRPHVLIVSDDRDLSEFLGEGLIYAGFWTSAIASALQVLEVFRLRSFDLVLLDAALGGIGAAELLRRLRGPSDQAPGTERTDVPIIVVAATSGEIDPKTASDTGVSTVLIAPLEIDQVARAANEAVVTWRAAHPGRPWADAAALEAP